MNEQKVLIPATAELVEHTFTWEALVQVGSQHVKRSPGHRSNRDAQYALDAILKGLGAIPLGDVEKLVAAVRKIEGLSDFMECDTLNERGDLLCLINAESRDALAPWEVK